MLVSFSLSLPNQERVFLANQIYLYMKHFIISSSDLDTAFDKLYELGKNYGIYFTAKPYEESIEVFNDPGEMIAKIKIVDVAEPYEVAKEISKFLI